jgi:hypothetical protein
MRLNLGLSNTKSMGGMESRSNAIGRRPRVVRNKISFIPKDRWLENIPDLLSEKLN